MILSVVVYKAEISGGVIPFTMGLLAWQRHGFSCKIYNADFSDAHDVCSIDESGFTEAGYRKFCDSCGAGTRN